MLENLRDNGRAHIPELEIVLRLTLAARTRTMAILSPLKRIEERWTASSTGKASQRQ